MSMRRARSAVEKAGLIMALAWEVLGLWVIVDSYRMGLQTVRDPGVGLFPFLLGVLLCCLGLAVLVGSVRAPDTGGEAGGGEQELVYGSNRRKIIAVVVVLIGYFIFLDVLGFVVTTFLSLFGLFWVGYPRKWLPVFLASAVGAALSYLLFSVVLRVPFPPGVFR